MPLNKTGKKIERAMVAEYGPKKGKNVLYASRNAGKLPRIEKSGGKKKGAKR